MPPFFWIYYLYSVNNALPSSCYSGKAAQRSCLHMHYCQCCRLSYRDFPAIQTQSLAENTFGRKSAKIFKLMDQIVFFISYTFKKVQSERGNQAENTVNFFSKLEEFQPFFWALIRQMFLKFCQRFLLALDFESASFELCGRRTFSQLAMLTKLYFMRKKSGESQIYCNTFPPPLPRIGPKHGLFK